MILTGWGANCWGQKRLRRNYHPKILGDRISERDSKRRDVIFVKITNTKFLRRSILWDSNRTNQTRSPRIHAVRSLCSNQTWAKARSLCSDWTFPNIDTTPVLAFSSNLRMLSPEDRSKLSLCFKLFQFIDQTSRIRNRGKLVVNVSSRKTAQRDLKHDSRPILRFFLTKSPWTTAWFTLGPRGRINVKFPRINTEVLKIIVKIGKNGISPFLCYDGLRAEE